MTAWITNFLLLVIAVGVWFSAVRVEAATDLLADIKECLEADAGSAR
jgi:hypothetical protein